MDKNVSEHLSEYKSQYRKYNSLMRKVVMRVISYDDLLSEVDPKEVERLREICVGEYADILEKEGNKELKFFQLIRSATSTDDFYLLEVLLLVKGKVTGVDFTDADLFLLTYFGKYFEKNVDDEDMRYAKYLFEWILDVLDRDTEECSEILERIFSLGKPPQWYEGFYDQIMKLTLRAPVNGKTFSAVKKGLSITTTGDIKEFLEEYLERRMI